MAKVAIQYWDSDNTNKIIYKSIKEGTITLKIGGEKKTFIVKDVKPYWYWKKKTYTGWLGFREPVPMYVFRHDNAFPHTFQFKKDKKPVRSIFKINWKRNQADRELLKRETTVDVPTESGIIQETQSIDLQEMIDPSTVTEMMEQRTVKTLMSLQGATMKDNFMWLLIGVVIGGPIGIIVAPMLATV